MRGFEQIPWLYDACSALCERAGLARWRAWLAGDASGRVLDLGCGTGRNFPFYAAAGTGEAGRGAALVGADPEAAALARARRRGRNVALVQARAEALPFRDGTFDVVVCGLVFCSVREPGRALAEMRRVLRRDGRVRMLEHVRARTPWLGRLQDCVQPLWTRVAGGCHPNRDTEHAVQAACFTIVPGTRRAHGSLRRFEAR